MAEQRRGENRGGEEMRVEENKGNKGRKERSGGCNSRPAR